ncbi:hypothetical protein M8330_21555, partial [Nocardioides sp. BSK12Z-4]|nr:hypothetical protein [Nocardioides bruguierae]
MASRPGTGGTGSSDDPGGTSGQGEERFDWLYGRRDREPQADADATRVMPVQPRESGAGASRPAAQGRPQPAPPAPPRGPDGPSGP